jgi:hypothetical protein
MKEGFQRTRYREGGTFLGGRVEFGLFFKTSGRSESVVEEDGHELVERCWVLHYKQ